MIIARQFYKKSSQCDWQLTGYVTPDIPIRKTQGERHDNDKPDTESFLLKT